MEIQYKILHNIINTATNLKNWRIKEEDTCQQCNDMPEDIFHFFIGCKKNNNLIKYILQELQLEVPTNEELIFGSNDKLTYTITAYIKYCIYNTRQYKNNMDYINKQDAMKTIQEKLSSDSKLSKCNLEPFIDLLRNKRAPE